MVDHLVLGDASPSELAAHVGLGSNLLAHHLSVLEDAGIIRRVRSEGDRRRSYVQLRTDHPLVRAAALTEQLTRMTAGTAPRIVFVCTANSARSQLAAATWNQLSAIPATSAGTHPGPRIHPRAIATARRHGLRLTATRPVAVDDQLRDGDLVVAVCDNAHEELEPDPAAAALGHPRPGPRRHRRRLRGRLRRHPPTRPPPHRRPRRNRKGIMTTPCTDPADRPGPASASTPRSRCAPPPPGSSTSSAAPTAPRRSNGSWTPPTTNSPTRPPSPSSCP